MDVTIRRKLDFIITEIQRESREIENAVLRIGVPLEEAIVFFVRSRLHKSASDFHERPVTENEA